jgi:hypothetical protein
LTDYSLSCFVKKGSLNFIQILLINTANSATASKVFDVESGLIGETIIYGGGTLSDSKIEDYGNGWFKCTIVAQLTSAPNSFRINLANSLNNNTSSLGMVQYSGDGNGYVYIYGAQVEQGSYATSYIPTQGAAVTRVGEILVQDNMSTSLFNKDGMAIYLEVEALANDDINKAITISDGSNSNRFVFQFTNNNEINVFAISTLGFTGLSIGTLGADITQTNKIATSFNSSNGYLYVNGTQIDVDSINNGIGNNLNKISFGNHNLANNIFYGKIMDFKTYNTALTDEELAALTTI